MQNQPQQFQNNMNQAQSQQMMQGGHEMFDSHEAISSLVGGLEHCLLYEPHIQDAELKTMMQKQKGSLQQLYNTLVETLKTGQEPSVKTQTYNITTQNIDVVYGKQPGQPSAPAQSAQEIDDKCISSFWMDHLKNCSSTFTKTALETTNPVLRRVFADSIPNLIEMAYEVFLYQNKNGYYQVPKLSQEDMQAYRNSFAPIQNPMTH
jgi:spore coat protein CotF